MLAAHVQGSAGREYRVAMGGKRDELHPRRRTVPDAQHVAGFVDVHFLQTQFQEARAQPLGAMRFPERRGWDARHLQLALGQLTGMRAKPIAGRMYRPRSRYSATSCSRVAALGAGWSE